MSLQSRGTKSETQRALLGVAVGGKPILLATDGAGIAWMADAIPSIDAVEIGLCDERDCPSPGLYLFTGHSTLELETWDAPFPTETVWHGTVRAVLPEEVAALYAMDPPPEHMGGEWGDGPIPEPGEAT